MKLPSFSARSLLHIVIAFTSAVMAFGVFAGPAHAEGQPANHAPFAAQAAKLGLTKAEAGELQGRVDAALSTEGGVQTKVNEISRDHGASFVRFALPGKTQSSGSSSLAAVLACPYYYFCAYPDSNFVGDYMEGYSSCENHKIWYSGTGSWINNQTPGTEAQFKDQGGVTRWSDPGAYSYDRSADWTWVWWVRPC